MAVPSRRTPPFTRPKHLSSAGHQRDNFQERGCLQSGGRECPCLQLPLWMADRERLDRQRERLPIHEGHCGADPRKRFLFLYCLISITPRLDCLLPASWLLPGSAPLEAFSINWYGEAWHLAFILCLQLLTWTPGKQRVFHTLPESRPQRGDLHILQKFHALH